MATKVLGNFKFNLTTYLSEARITNIADYELVDYSAHIPLLKKKIEQMREELLNSTSENIKKTQLVKIGIKDNRENSNTYNEIFGDNVIVVLEANKNDFNKIIFMPTEDRIEINFYLVTQGGSYKVIQMPIHAAGRSPNFLITESRAQEFRELYGQYLPILFDGRTPQTPDVYYKVSWRYAWTTLITDEYVFEEMIESFLEYLQLRKIDRLQETLDELKLLEDDISKKELANLQNDTWYIYQCSPSGDGVYYAQLSVALAAGFNSMHYSFSVFPMETRTIDRVYRLSVVDGLYTLEYVKEINISFDLFQSDFFRDNKTQFIDANGVCSYFEIKYGSIENMKNLEIDFIANYENGTIINNTENTRLYTRYIEKKNKIADIQLLRQLTFE